MESRETDLPSPAGAAPGKFAGAVASFCRGTLGELYQGPFFRGNSVHIAVVSALADSGTEAVFCPGEPCNLRDLKKYRVKDSLQKYLGRCDKAGFAGCWRFNSALRIGAGMSSSTADIIAALRCFHCCLKGAEAPLALGDIAKCLLNVERSDSVFIDVPCLYLSARQEIIELYTQPKSIFCLYALERGRVNTEKARSRLLSYYQEEETRYRRLLYDVRRAFAAADARQIIACATQSAALSQNIFPKKNFDSFYRSCENLGAEGLITAHTGVLLGFLFTEEPSGAVKRNVRNFVEAKGLELCEGRIF